MSGIKKRRFVYGIEFRVKPTSDIDATNDSDRYNMCVVWADDTYNYRVAIDKDSDNGGAGTTGGIKCGSVASWQCFVDYNAANVTNQTPNKVTPKWRISGSSSIDSSVWSDQGDYLLMNLDDDGDPVDQGDPVSWISPQTCIDMKKGGYDYKIEVKVQPIGDLVSTGYSYEYAQIAVYWADDVNTEVKCGNATAPFYNSISFGDTTTGGNDAAATWDYARVHDLNVPCNADH